MLTTIGIFLYVAIGLWTMLLIANHDRRSGTRSSWMSLCIGGLLWPIIWFIGVLMAVAVLRG